MLPLSLCEVKWMLLDLFFSPPGWNTGLWAAQSGLCSNKQTRSCASQGKKAAWAQDKRQILRSSLSFPNSGHDRKHLGTSVDWSDLLWCFGIYLSCLSLFVINVFLSLLVGTWPFTTAEAAQRISGACALWAAVSGSTRSDLFSPAQSVTLLISFPLSLTAQEWSLCCSHSTEPPGPWSALCPRAWLRTWASSGTQRPGEVYMTYLLCFGFVHAILRAVAGRTVTMQCCLRPQRCLSSPSCSYQLTRVLFSDLPCCVFIVLCVIITTKNTHFCLQRSAVAPTRGLAA